MLRDEQLELARDEVGEAAAESRRALVEREVGGRGGIPGPLGPGAAGAFAVWLRVVEHGPQRRGQPFHVARLHDEARAEAPHRLGQPAHVVDDRRHAGAERRRSAPDWSSSGRYGNTATVASPWARSTSASER